VRFEL